MPNQIIQNYLNDTSIDVEKRRFAIDELKKGTPEDKIVSGITTKYGDKYGGSGITDRRSVSERNTPVNPIQQQIANLRESGKSEEEINKVMSKIISGGDFSENAVKMATLGVESDQSRAGKATDIAKETFKEGARMSGAGVSDIATGITGKPTFDPKTGQMNQPEPGLIGRAGQTLTGVGETIAGGVIGGFSPLAGLLGLASPEIEKGVTKLVESGALTPEQGSLADQGIKWYQSLPEDQKTQAQALFELATMGVGGRTAKELKQPVKKGFEKLGQAAIALENKLLTSNNVKKDILESLDKGIIQAIEAEQLAKQFGVDLPASAIATPAKAKAEQIIGEGFFGQDIKKKAEKAISDFEVSVSDIQSKAPTSGELGEEIVNKFKAVEKERKKIINDLYGQAEEMIKEGRNVYVNAENTNKLIKEIIDRKKLSAVASPSEIAKLEQISNGLANVNLDVHRATLKDIGVMANFDNILSPTTDEKLFRKLYSTLKKDIDNSISKDLPELAPTLKKANEEFKKLEELKQRPFATSIKKLGEKGDVDTLADRLTKTKVSTNEIKQIYDTLGKDTTQKIQAKIIADIAEKAKSATGGFTNSGFAKQIKAIGEERLSAILTKDQIQLLKNLDKVNQLIAKASTVARGSQTNTLQQIARIISAPATGGMSVLGEKIAALILQSKRGQKWLKGFDEKLSNQVIEALAKQGDKLK